MKSKILAILLIVIGVGCIQDENLKIAINTTPPDQQDGWILSSPKDENMQQEKLNNAIDYFFSENDLPNSKTLLIAKNNKLVLEAYCKDLDDRNRLQNIKSVTKSISSILTGIAIKQEILDSNLNKKVHDYIPENFDADVQKQKITLEHCLRMTTGLKDPFYSVASILPDNSATTCLGVSLTDAPGIKHFYNNGSANIIGAAIEKEYNNSFEKFTVTKLFSPLNINKYHWIKHNDGRVNPAFDLFLLPRDVLKFGQFCLQNGNWQGQQITPTNWISKSTQPLENGFDGPFGFHWWILEKYNGYYANGHGGQRVWILPDQNMVIVHLAEPSTDQTNLNEVRVLLDLIMEAI